MFAAVRGAVPVPGCEMEFTAAGWGERGSRRPLSHTLSRLPWLDGLVVYVCVYKAGLWDALAEAGGDEWTRCRDGEVMGRGAS